MNPLDGPRLKITRALEHIQAFQRAQAMFFERDPYTISEDFYVGTGKHLFRIHVLREAPRHRLAALVGDCAHSLRSALDHLVWRLSEDFSGAVERDTSTQFPIFKTESGYESRGTGKIQRVGPGATAVIRALQPFHKHVPEVHPLWLLSELDNGDKHRELAVTAVVAHGYGHRIQGTPQSPGGTFKLTVYVEDIRDGEVIAELTVSPADPEIRVNARFEFEFALAAPTVPNTDPRLFVVGYFTELARVVKGTIDCFEPFYTSGVYDDTVVLADPLGPLHAAKPPELRKKTEAEHEEWSSSARSWVNDVADISLEAVVTDLGAAVVDPAALEKAVLPRLRLSAMYGFLKGVEMGVNRRDEQYDELEPLP